MASPTDPSWAAPAQLTGVIAALGYVGKKGPNWFNWKLTW